MNDDNETVIDIKRVAVIRKRERSYGIIGKDEQEDVAITYYIDVFLDTHSPCNEIKLEYSDQQWRNKEYDGIRKIMELL